MPVDLAKLHDKSLAELRAQASAAGIEGAATLRRTELVFQIAVRAGERENQSYGRGVLEVHGEGFGFLRSPDDNFLPGAGDIYVSQSQIRRFKLQTGDTIIGIVRPPKEGERYPALLRVESINGDPPGVEPPDFDSLTAIYPDDRLPLGDSSLAALDFVAPLGLGQRGLLLAPPETLPEPLLRTLCETIAQDDELEVTAMLIAERPEEIAVWRKLSSVEVIATPIDDAASRHVQVADIVFERGRRMVERGDDGIIVLVGVDRLLRAVIEESDGTGPSLDGLPIKASARIRRYIATARALEEGGSLTIIAVLTGSSDHPLTAAVGRDLAEIANWRITLSSELAARGIHPPIDLARSGNRYAGSLLDSAEIERRLAWRASLSGEPAEDAEALSAAASGTPQLDSVAGSGQ